MTLSDAPAVLGRARRGDEDAFRALVEKHSGAAFRLAFRITGHEQDAEDVVQESFLRAFRHLAQFEARADFGTWLHRIIVNCAVEMIRTRHARQIRARMEPLDLMTLPPASTNPGPERLAASADIRRRLATALHALSPLERAAFTLRHYEGRTIDEISRTLRLRTSATKHAIFRAVRKLRAAFEGMNHAPLQ